MLTIGPDEEVHREISVDFPTVAPLAASSPPDHSTFAEWLSGAIRSDRDAAGLVVVLRNNDDGPKLLVDSIELLDSRLERVHEWDSRWVLGGNDIAGKATLLAPGL
ncbi:hypothetical protein [Mycobacterium sp. 360MFTsu5.1]|uniref:hypothetical protein n=1 Tax=Mycobacterium sp. 360MFTsu5.1 TaxID=1172186 RepID=UPI00037A2676|nr:hypothetical protein [Mycobacterium sp. 360MFTsu5.1]